MEVPSRQSTSSRGGGGASDQSCGSLSRLPDEILGEISYHVMRIITNTVDPYIWPENPYAYYYRWTLVSQVCRRWRQVVLATPRLWTTITLPCNAMWLQIMVKRSGQVPLTVIAVVPFEQPELDLPEAHKALITEMARRTKYLQLNLDTCLSYDILTALSAPGAKAPLLEVLTIKTDTEAFFMPTFVDGQLPHLRHLTYDLPLSEEPLLEEILLSSLTGLHLHHIDPLISVESCLEILAALPNLEDLVLGKVLSPDSAVLDTQPPLPDSLVHLPCLRKIAFQGASEWLLWEGDVEDDIYNGCMHIADVLRHLVVPSSTEISFAVGEEYLVGETLNFICDTLRDAVIGQTVAVLGSPRSPATHCHIKLKAQGDYTVECVVELFGTVSGADKNELQEFDISEEQFPGAKNRILWSQFRTNFTDFYDCVKCILKSFGPAFSAVTNLHLTGYLADPICTKEKGPHHLDAIWLCLQERMPELRHLSLLGYSADFIRWLSAALKSESGLLQPGPEKARAPVFPLLQSLGVDSSERAWKNPLLKTDADNSDESISVAEDLDVRVQLVSAVRSWSGQFEDERRLRQLIIVALTPYGIEGENFDEIRTSGIAWSVKIRDLCEEFNSCLNRRIYY